MITKTFGSPRPVTVTIPASYNTSPLTPRPLILLLHSYTSSGASFTVEFFGSPSAIANHAALPNGAFVVAPDGTVDAGLDRFWNASTACCDEAGSAVDDDAYLIGLIDSIIAAGYPIDPRRIGVIGRSNGGFMAQRLACLHSDRITSIIDVHGAGPNGTDYTPGPILCTPANKVHMMHWHGSADSVVPFGGGAVSAVTGMADAPSAATTAAAWATINGCTGPLTPYGPAIDLDSAVVGNETQPAAYTGCPINGAVEFWTLAGSGHNISYIHTEWEDRIIGWFADHPR